MNILHIVHDDKFIDGVINTLSGFNCCSKFILLTNNLFVPKYIKQRDVVEQVIIGSTKYETYLQEKWADFLWIHFLDIDKAIFANAYSGGGKIIWGTWGADYYDTLHKPVLMPITALAWMYTQVKSHGLLGGICDILSALERAILYKVGKWGKLVPRPFLTFYKKVSYFTAVIPEEEDLIRKLIGTTPIYLKFHYCNASQKAINPQTTACELYDSSNISVWVGNSAFYTNNSFDALYRLSRMHNISKVIAPLSYGPANVVAQTNVFGRYLLKGKWIPLLKFMSVEDYSSQMRKCQAFVFGHIRQQAVGNIDMALQMGGCLFMHRKNPVYRYFSSHGVKIYTLDRLREMEAVLQEFANYRENNKTICRTFRSLDKKVQDIRETMILLESDSKSFTKVNI